jgi:protein-disulfide isomerase
MPAIEKEYVGTGKVRVIFRHLPLESIHPFAKPAAEAAACADRQGRFGDMHDRLFADQKRLDAAGLAESVKALKLNAVRYAACLADDGPRRVQEDAAGAKALGVTGTPAFLIGLLQADGRVKAMQRLSGAVPVAQFKSALDTWLSVAASQVGHE